MDSCFVAQAIISIATHYRMQIISLLLTKEQAALLKLVQCAIESIAVSIVVECRQRVIWHWAAEGGQAAQQRAFWPVELIIGDLEDVMLFAAFQLGQYR